MEAENFLSITIALLICTDAASRMKGHIFTQCFGLLNNYSFFFFFVDLGL